MHANCETGNSYCDDKVRTNEGGATRHLSLCGGPERYACVDHDNGALGECARQAIKETTHGERLAIANLELGVALVDLSEIQSINSTDRNCHETYACRCRRDDIH